MKETPPPLPRDKNAVLCNRCCPNWLRWLLPTPVEYIGKERCLACELPVEKKAWVVEVALGAIGELYPNATAALTFIGSTPRKSAKVRVK